MTSLTNWVNINHITVYKIKILLDSVCRQKDGIMKIADQVNLKRHNTQIWYKPF